MAVQNWIAEGDSPNPDAEDASTPGNVWTGSGGVSIGSNSPVPSTWPSIPNDVWGTLNTLITSARDTAIARAAIRGQVQAQSTPNGQSSSWLFNPFPGLFGQYPQAQGKPVAGVADGSSMMNWGALGGGVLLVLGLIIAVIAVFARK